MIRYAFAFGSKGGMNMYRPSGSYWISCLVVVLCLTGCAVARHKTLDPKSIPNIHATNCRSIVVEKTISVMIPESISGQAFGIIGGLVDYAKTTRRSKDADRRIVPLLEQTTDVDFQKDFWAELVPMIRACKWLHVDSVMTTSTPAGITASDARHHYLLQLATSYELSPDCVWLIVSTDVQFFNIKDENPIHFGCLTYYSDRVGNEAFEPSIAAWSADSAFAYRAALRQGIDETVKMLRMDFLDCNVPPKWTSKEKTKLSYISPMYGERITRKGDVIARDGDRIIFREKEGNLWSMNLDDLQEPVKKHTRRPSDRVRK
jgi:hypothetical protein